jgi:ADP-ribose pyrophosphatase YjhB (NUDIX family)
MAQPTEDKLIAGYLPHIAFDTVVFGFSGDQLKILLLEFRDTNWFALPGGFIQKDEDLDLAVKRGLKQRTGLDNLHLEQFHTFGSMQRSQPEVMRTILRNMGDNPNKYPWMLDRFISVGYYCLIDYQKVTPTPDYLSDSIDWHPVDELPPLLFDHREMVDKALEVLRRNLDTMLVGINMLPERFTIKELQLIHEAILGEKLSRTSFQRHMLASGLLERHEKRFGGGAHKAPYLYSFVGV